MPDTDLDAAFKRLNQAREYVHAASVNVAMAPPWDDTTERALFETAVDEYRAARAAYDAVVEQLRLTGAVS